MNIFSMALLPFTLLLGLKLAHFASSESINSAAYYLIKFGYMDAAVTNPNASAGLQSEEVMENAIMEFQAFAGINVTGKMDDDTKYLMSLPRCGVKDKVGFGTKARKKRYALQGSRWRVKKLNYNIVKYPSTRHGLKRSEVDEIISKALNVWSEHTDLVFTRKKSGKSHIDISFVSGEHGDGDPFDGRGGTLAHAYFPVYGGDAHFDDAERWTIHSRFGTDLFQVAAHEFGHSLGLSHSDVQASLMAPFYRGYDASFELHEDDVKGIQRLYGKKTNKVPPSQTTTTRRPTTKRPTSTRDDPVLCSAFNSIDAIVNDPDDNTYVFKGSQVWLLTDSGVAKGYPKKISEVFKGLPNNIDAGFSWTTKGGKKMFFFKGKQYYRVVDYKVDDKYPKLISNGFAGIPDNVDTVFVWSGNGRIYFFKGKKYYRFDPTAPVPVSDRYPRAVDQWAGLPNNIDAALQYKNGYTYFFKGNNYYRFDDRTFKVDDSSDIPYPRPASEWWYGCSSSSHTMLGDANRGDVQVNNVDEDNDAGDECLQSRDLTLPLERKNSGVSLFPHILLVLLLVAAVIP